MSTNHQSYKSHRPTNTSTFITTYFSAHEKAIFTAYLPAHFTANRAAHWKANKSADISTKSPS